jgi:hypothetical protein
VHARQAGLDDALIEQLRHQCPGQHRPTYYGSWMR